MQTQLRRAEACRVKSHPFAAFDALRSHRHRQATADPPHAKALHEIFQNSTINALLEGVYDGSLTYGELRTHGDFGLGTFNALDGEMIAFDGNFYQVKSDGVAYPVADDQKTPFATVVFFRPTLRRSASRPARLRTIANVRRQPGRWSEPVLRGSDRRRLQLGEDAKRAPPAAAVPAAGRSGQAPACLSPRKTCEARWPGSDSRTSPAVSVCPDFTSIS